MLYGPTVIIVIIVIIIVIVIIGLSVIIDIIVLIAIMITSLSTDLFIRYNFIRFGCMDSAQHYLDSIKCIPPNSHGTAYTVRARNIYIYLPSCPPLSWDSCVFVLSFSVASIANVSGQTSATAWKLFLADLPLVIFP